MEAKEQERTPLELSTWKEPALRSSQQEQEVVPQGTHQRVPNTRGERWASLSGRKPQEAVRVNKLRGGQCREGSCLQVGQDTRLEGGQAMVKGDR